MTEYEYICEPIRDFEWDSGYECGYIRKGELIRCKDCRWYDHGENELEEWFGCKTSSGLLHPMPDEFCSRAERKVDADEKKQAYDFTITCLTENVETLTQELERFMSDEVGAENWVMRRELIEEEE